MNGTVVEYLNKRCIRLEKQRQPQSR